MKSTSKTFDEFLDSMTRQPEAILVCDLQVITLGEDALRDVRAALSDVADVDIESGRRTLVAEKWDAILKSARQASIGKPVGDGVSEISHSRLSAINGATVQVESVQQHGISLKRDDDGSLNSCANWSGWKLNALPFQREDGSFWLGMWFESGTVVGKDSLPPEHAERFGVDAPVTVHSYQQINFATRLKAGEVVVLPGFEIGHGNSLNQSAILTARVRRLSEKTIPDAVPPSRVVSGTGVKSAAGVAVRPEEKTQSTMPKVTRRANGNTVQQHGPYRVEFGLTPEYREKLQPGSYVPPPSNLHFTVSHSEATGKDSSIEAGRYLEMRADRNSLRTENGVLNLILQGNVELRAGLFSLKESKSSFSATADSLELSIPESQNADASISCRLTKAIVRYGVDNEVTPSMIRAEEIIVALNAETFEIASLNASKVDSLQVTDVKKKAARSRAVFQESRQLLSQWDTIRRRRSFQKLVSPNFDQTPLKEAIAWFRDSANLNIIIDESSLEEEGVRTTTPVTLKLKDVQADSVLRLLLQPFNLGVMVDEESGVLIVTSQFHMKGKMIAAAYPVTDLVTPKPKPVIVRLSGDGNATLQSDPPAISDEIRQTSASVKGFSLADINSIGELITTVVEPNSWQEVGGMGTLRPNDRTRSLVIRQTQDVHREITDLLDQLRRLRNVQVALQVQTLEVPQTFFAEWKIDQVFKPLSESKTHCWMRLSSAQAVELRTAGKSGQLPKVTLFNGQHCNLRLDDGDGNQQRWHVQPVASADHRFVRLGVGIDDGRSGSTDEAVPTSVTTIPDGDAILVEVAEQADEAARIVGVPVPGQKGAFKRVHNDRRFILIQAEVVVATEEEELLGIDVGK